MLSSWMLHSATFLYFCFVRLQQTISMAIGMHDYSQKQWLDEPGFVFNLIYSFNVSLVGFVPLDICTSMCVTFQYP